ncbi:amino acid adenylation domain-containing protein/thioester reductase domain-containing protein [Methylomagnum ishizawai]|uniref:Amino acid adenylation domain-containing protein/thioester reductase domain-containing protein n=1 Tax=Methylomagnum ishizawai TaxID=1760988 RepID=A0A1Y6D4S0_9GAMM|nr:non-ribosomal peptide synthetase [Methylomagnum ishizawai]SMF97571.1 amino acid adenylation domain-containing protein/thioester reductase domain-containing protein [Methylomagnum ishizawai]
MRTFPDSIPTGLSPAKRALLEKRLRGGGGLPAQHGTIARRPPGDPPLSFSQQRLWFLDQLERGQVAYNIPTALRLEGRLDVPALERAINEIVRRHEVLRTQFADHDGQPVQRVRPDLRIAIDRADLSGLPEAEREAEVLRRAREQGGKPFALEREALLRAELLYLGERADGGEYVLLFTLHHIVSDGWSAGVLFGEFAALYRAFREGRPSPLAELPIQYGDFAHWQRCWLSGERLERQLAYWRRRLAGAPPLLDLPTDHPRPAVQSGRGAIHLFRLPPGPTERLRGLCRERGATLFAALVAAFDTLLHRYSGQTDLCLGVAVANRIRPELDGLIGLFVNMLVLRADLSGDPPFTGLLAQVQALSLAAQEHQDLPFEKLVEELNPVRDRGYTPFFQVVLVLHNLPARSFAIPELTVRRMEVDFGTAKSDLTLHVTEDDGLELALEYSTDLFEPDRIARMAGHFQSLLVGIAGHPDARLGELPLLTAEERRCFDAWNATDRELHAPAGLHALLERQAAARPERIAVVCGERSLGYGALERQAAALAGHLRGRGVGPESRVGLCLERSVEAIVGIFAILKAGGAYVPFDPATPAERIAELLADSGAAWVLTLERWAGRFPAGVEAISLDREFPPAPVAASAPVHPGQAAYLIYTSGSTGRPKGVVVDHRNALASTLARRDFYPEPPGVFLMVSPFAFDSSVAGIFWTLAEGGRLCLPSEAVHRDPLAWVDLIQREGATHLLCLPSLYGLLLDCAAPGQLDSLRAVIVAGETCPEGLAARHHARLPTARLYNEYGPTEATVWCSAHEIPPVIQGAVPIGGPIANTRLHILDARLNPVPVGVPGELYIGGAGVARGYHAHPGATAERFLPDPHAPAQGARLYRSGDLARFRADGAVEFLGRADHQVKIRGLRIEPGEIEARLLGHPAVKAAAVVAREDQPGHPRLVAYVVPDRADAPEAELRRFLKACLPEHMVPGAFVILECLPSTPNGKLDRSALPAPGGNATVAPPVAPRDPWERQLAGLWREVLGGGPIGIHDNFFDLGGHSLAAMRLVARLRERLGIALPVARLFEAPTVAELAAWLRQDTPEAPQAAIDWQREATLDAAIAPDLAGWTYPQSQRAVFVTGATGFLGAFLVDALVRRTQARIYCLVRSPGKLEQTFAAYGLALDERIVPVLGDLALPSLGIDAVQYQELGTTLDTIYHSGALANFVYPYSLLKPANVAGTEAILRLACIGRPKSVHYVSTLSILGDDPSLDEDDFPPSAAHLADGYAQSKWVAESLVRTAAARGLPVCIYRPGQIAGHRHSGVWNTGDYLCRMLKAYVEAGSAPLEAMALDLAPVDYVSQAIVALAHRAECLGKTFHLNHPEPVSTHLFLAALADAGFQLRRTPMREWLGQMVARAEDRPEHPLYPLLSLFQNGTAQDDQGLDTPRRACEKTLEILREDGIECPPMDAGTLANYIAYFLSSGFLEAPQPAGSI